MTIRTSARLGGLLAFLFAVAMPAAAQPRSEPFSADARWAPWLGCWRLVDETLQDPASLADAVAALGRARANANARVCVAPAPGGGVTFTTFVGETPVLTETIVADGAEKPLDEPDCRGWHRATWSALGPRLFAEAEIACGDQPRRTVSGLSLVLAGPQWLEVQLIEEAGRRNLRVRRYQPLATPAERAPVSQRTIPLPVGLTIADVKEAAGRVAPEALQAALAELRGGFHLDARRLIDLDDAGVPDAIIDLMVALSFPERFVVERRVTPAGGRASGGFDSMWPYYAHPSFYTSYYAPFGYHYWGFYDPFYFQGPGFVILDSDPSPQPSGAGRVVDGRGYTRVRRSDPEPAHGSGGAWGSSSSGGTGSSGGGVSSSGYSSGGGGGERTAQPRPPGS